jgi:hypothetical protein
MPIDVDDDSLYGKLLLKNINEVFMHVECEKTKLKFSKNIDFVYCLNLYF